MDVKEQQQKLRGKQYLKRVLLLVFILTILLSLYNYYYTTITYLHYGVHQFISTRAVFLFCNAILLFIVRDSGLLSSSKLHDNYFIERMVDNHLEADVVDKSAVVLESIESSASLELVMEVEQVINQNGNELDVAVVDELQVLSVDELNKRCEEFIERMKREINMSS